MCGCGDGFTETAARHAELEPSQDGGHVAFHSGGNIIGDGEPFLVLVLCVLGGEPQQPEHGLTGKTLQLDHSLYERRSNRIRLW